MCACKFMRKSLPRGLCSLAFPKSSLQARNSRPGWRFIEGFLPGSPRGAGGEWGGAEALRGQLSGEAHCSFPRWDPSGRAHSPGLLSSSSSTVLGALPSPLVCGPPGTPCGSLPRTPGLWETTLPAFSLSAQNSQECENHFVLNFIFQLFLIFFVNWPDTL